MFVGDRSGTIYRVGFRKSRIFCHLSNRPFRLIIWHSDETENFIVTAPGLSSFDAFTELTKTASTKFFIADSADRKDWHLTAKEILYVAACLRGRHGIVKISADGEEAEIFVAGMNVVGLCFTRKGEMIVATNETIYSLPIGIRGL